MYSAGTGIVYGFHGGDRSIAEEIINQKLTLKNSKNEYDWLRNGMYFGKTVLREHLSMLRT